VPDPEGSLVDADMGAYYTWINLQRLSEAEKSSFLVWFENHGEALAIAPGLQRGRESNEPLSMPALLARLPESPRPLQSQDATVIARSPACA
jgi:hypothetical protein